MSMTDKETDDLISILSSDTGGEIELKYDGLGNDIIVAKFDINPTESVSGINAYIDKYRISADYIRDFQMVVRNDGMLSITLVWSKKGRTILVGPKGEKGDKGDTGEQGIPGLDT